MRLKLLLVSITAFIAIAGFGFLEKSQIKETEDISFDTSSSIKRLFDSSFKSYKLSAKKEHYTLLNNEKAMDILKKFKKASDEEKKLLRGELYRLFAKHYKYLKTLGVRQFHFHTVKGESLLRFHVPHSNGDSLMESRYSIKAANTEFKSIYGFEGGKIYPGFRYLFPILKDGEHLGSIEYSVSFEAIERFMKETFPMYTYHLHLDESISYKKVFKWHRNYFEPSVFGGSHYVENQSLSPVTSKVIEDPLVKELNSRITSKSDFEKRFLEKKDFSIPVIIDDIGYVVSFHSIKDTLGTHASYLVSYAKNEGLSELDEKYQVFRTMFFIAIILLFTLGYIVIDQFKKIVVQNEKLEATNIDNMEKIAEQKDELEAIFNTTKEGIAIVDLETNFLFVNRAYEEITGFSKKELIGKSCAGLSAPEDMQRVEGFLKDVIKKGFVDDLEKTCIVKDGKRIAVSISVSLMPDQQRLLLSTKDVTEQKRKERVIKDHIALIDKHIISSNTDLKGNITAASEAFCKISGYSKEELIGKNHRIIRHPDMDDDTFIQMWKTITCGKVWSGEVKNLKKDGSYYWVNASISPLYDEEGNISGYTSIRQDITDKKRVEEISITDALTNIYNRRYFNEIFPKIINTSKRKNELVCFIIMDVDFFKQYNDTYGHQMGDEVLIKVARCIKHSLKRATDYCFRLGGEEFGVIYNVEKEEQSMMFADKIRQSIEELHIEHSKSDVSEYVTASMGLVCKRAETIESVEVIYKEADELLYKAKRRGRNRVVPNLNITLI